MAIEVSRNPDVIDAAYHALWDAVGRARRLNPRMPEAHRQAQEIGDVLVDAIGMLFVTVGDPLGAHCWEDGGGSSCLLPDGHSGPHEFTSDDEIQIRFVE